MMFGCRSRARTSDSCWSSRVTSAISEEDRPCLGALMTTDSLSSLAVKSVVPEPCLSSVTFCNSCHMISRGGRGRYMVMSGRGGWEASMELAAVEETLVPLATAPEDSISRPVGGMHPDPMGACCRSSVGVGTLGDVVVWAVQGAGASGVWAGARVPPGARGCGARAAGISEAPVAEVTADMGPAIGAIVACIPALEPRAPCQRSAAGACVQNWSCAVPWCPVAPAPPG
mmetsp:Transcript_12630/g.36587  ORF Transcript_12630/g.36587 Transcript_12630/m.36587 type:complete len:229 (-) Transcript_12630:456-1142(-)